jgi:hypothetical protein
MYPQSSKKKRLSKIFRHIIRLRVAKSKSQKKAHYLIGE